MLCNGHRTGTNDLLQQVFDELVRRTANFIQTSLSSDSCTVQSIVNMAVFSLWMTSPLGHNALFCRSRYIVMLENVNTTNRTLGNQFVCKQESDEFIFRATLIRRLLQVISSDLVLTAPEFSKLNISNMIDCIAHLP
jgi:hypothetical protein